MRLQLQRIASNISGTIGSLHIDSVPECFTLEDEYRSVKKQGETRIPAGSYEIKLRREGGHYNRYRARFEDVHTTPEHGMLCITNADNWKLVNDGLEFQYVLIHIGNSDDDTAGCLLTGSIAGHPNHGQAYVQHSTKAYKALYKKVSDALLLGEKVFIDIYDEGSLF